MTYSEFEKKINSVEGYSFLYENNAVQVFFNYKKQNEQWGSNTIQEPLFIVSMIEAFDFRTPWGFHFTSQKNIKGFSEVAAAVIQLSRTPLSLRK